MAEELNTWRRFWRPEIDQLVKKAKGWDFTQPTVAFYGSSSIRLWGSMMEDLAPFRTLNLGFGGSSYFWCNDFFEEVFEHVRPAAIVLYAGDNDLGNAIPIPRILTSVDQLLDKISATYGSIPVAMIGVKPSPSRESLRPLMDTLNEAIQQQMTARQNGRFINVQTAMLDMNGMARNDLFLSDELHMNDKGYVIWKEVVHRHLSEINASIHTLI